MTNPNYLKQNVPFEEKVFPFTTVFIRSSQPQILHLHWHDEWEIIFMTKGEAVFHIGTEKVTAKANDLLFVNKGEIHTGFAIGNSLVEYYAVIFDPNLLGLFLSDSNDLEIIQGYKSGKYMFPLSIKTENPYYSNFKDTVGKLIREYEKHDIGTNIAIRSLLHLLLVDFMRYVPISASSTNRHYDAEMDEKFKQLISHIEAHYAEKITLEDVTKIVNLSTYHFCRLFKRITGKTFIEYLNLYRIHIAETKLLETNDPVTQIAYDVGFGSINYFSQMFKQYKRLSPSQYRKMHFK